MVTIFVCALACGTVAFAQPPTPPAVQGTVMDQTGAVIVGVSVTLTDSQGQKRTAATNDRGEYVFAQLPPGRYALTVKSKGFHDFSARVEVQPGSQATVDARLKVGISMAAEVKGKEPPGLSTDPRKNLSSLVLTPDEIAALPDDPERMLRRILEMAGSTGRPGDVAVFLDGLREYHRFPPKSTIEMIRINSNPFSAEFSQPSLDKVEIMTKPGSDTFHGEGMFQGASSVLDARNPMSQTKPDAQTLNYTGFLQGPIDKGRIDFQAYAGQWRQDDTAAIHATVLDPTTSAVQPLATAVTTPIRTRSLMAGTNVRASNQRLNLSYTRNDETRDNEGLDSGLDLPEHAYNQSTADQIGRAWWMSVGQRSVNDVRFELSRTRTDGNPLLTGPAVLVVEAFNAGGNQNVIARTSTTGLQGSETLTLQRGAHTVKAGATIEDSNYDSIDRSGFGGTFVFAATQSTIPISPIENYRRTVLGVPGYGPSEFWIVRGTPDVGVRQWNFGSFIQDDWSLSNRVSLSYGLRQDLQSNVAERLYLAPRASLSWLLDAKAKNAIKLGAGIFTGRVDPAITLDTKKTNGVDRQLLIIERPTGFPALPSPADLTAAQSAVHTMAPDLRLPYSFIGTVSYERQLPAGLFAVGQFTYSRDLHLLRLRDTSDPGAAAPVLQFESSGRSLQREFMAALRGNVTRDLTLFINYTYGSKYSDTDGPYTTPANPRDLSGEYGPAADDQRHQFVSGATLELRTGLSVSPYMSITSGRPFNITTGRDNNGDTLFSDRPAFATSGDSGAIATRYGWLDPNPKPGDLIIPRNFGRLPPLFTFNVSVTQMLMEGVSVTIDVENLTNHSRIVGLDGVLTSPTFGLPVQALSGRHLVLTIRGNF